MGMDKDQFKGRAFKITASELNGLGMDRLPLQFKSAEHLILSSPAALSFNSPGAEGFGVKRASLTVPGSVLLVVSPGCCGRNTSGIGDRTEYRDRFFFLDMDEADIVTGRHLNKIPEAAARVAEEVLKRTGKKPSVIMICITCVDALLGTDMDRVSKKAEEKAGVPVRPSYMYALTREGRKPPMVHIRQSIYSLLEERKKVSTSINILGFFSPLAKDCELYDVFRSMGIKKIREVSACRDYDEFTDMGEANFNVVLNPEARPAAADLEERLKIPYIELKRLYQMDKIESQYKALGKALGFSVDVSRQKEAAREAIERFKGIFKGREKLPSFAVGEIMNGDPFELAYALIREGFTVSEIFGTVTEENFIYIRKIAELSPDTEIMSNLDPGMLYYENDGLKIDITIGKDAAYYHPESRHLNWNGDTQPFGFSGVRHLFEELYGLYNSAAKAPEDGVRLRYYSDKKEGPEGVRVLKPVPLAESLENVKGGSAEQDVLEQSGVELIKDQKTDVRGMRLFLPPFAPDQSGASSVFYGLGGLTVICDAGGCAGNVCGFDEPRWLDEKSAIFSAGLRDMDAILGRDDHLVEKIKRAASVIDANFAAVIGTPVPAVIGTDYKAIKRMAEKDTGLKVIGIDTTGTGLYDEGAEKAYLELFKAFAAERSESEAADTGPADCITEGLSGDQKRLPVDGFTGIIGASPLDMLSKDPGRFFADALGTEDICCYGADGGLDAFKRAAYANKNIVVAPSGLKAAQYLEECFGVPFITAYPGADRILSEITPEDPDKEIYKGKRVLIVHQEILAAELCRLIMELGAKEAHAATWFKSEGAARAMSGEAGLKRIIAETDPDIIIADAVTIPYIKSFSDRELTFIDLPHFAVSGRQTDIIYDRQ